MSTNLPSAELLRPARDGEAEVGERVTVIDLATSAVRDYRLVATDAARASDGDLSISTALGYALLGTHVGDVFSVDEGGRLSRLEVVEIAETSGRQAMDAGAARDGLISKPGSTSSVDLEETTAWD